MRHRCEIAQIDACTFNDPVIQKAAGIIQKGGVVVFPTTSLYGLGVDAFHHGAVESVFKIKKRPVENPLLVLIDKERDLHLLVKAIPAKANILMDAFWPGNITLIMEAVKNLPRGLTGGKGKVGVRVPANPVARALVAACNGPVTGTSANLSGHPGAASSDAVDADVLKAADLVLDSGRLKGGAGSTVVDLTCDPPVMLREGLVSKRDLFEALNKG